jgi:4-hydroxy-tetrahydrodipicolinate reductase
MKKIVVVGANGKMGSVVCSKLEENHFDVIKIDLGDDLNSANSADMIIDFANGASSAVSAEFAEKRKIPLVVGSTGQTKEEEKKIVLASKKVAVLKASNFSLGLHKLKKCLKTLLELKPTEVVVFEKHHREKKDMPSGTAIELKQEIERYFDGNIQMLSLRGGKEIGTHTLSFYFGSETISISHQAFSREAFADGVVFAVGKMFSKQAGMYSIDDLLTKSQIKNGTEFET